MRKTAIVLCIFISFVLCSVLASELKVDITTSQSSDRIAKDGNATMRVSIKSSGLYEALFVNVTAPTARYIEMTPESIPVDIIGDGETRDYEFTIKNNGQDNGSYNVFVNVYNKAGNLTTKKTMLYVGETAKTPSFEFFVALATLVSLALLKRKRQ